MPLHIDGKEIELSAMTDNMSKASISQSWSNMGSGAEKVTFKKNGSELKGILYSKKRQIEDCIDVCMKKIAVLRNEIGESKSGSREGHVDNIEIFMEEALPHDTVKQLTEEEQIAYKQVREAMYKLEVHKRDLKVVETLISHLDDTKSYTINLDQLQSIEKAGSSEGIQKAVDKSKEKVDKIMSQFKEGTLMNSEGEKVTDKKEAMAMAMSQAGISKDYSTGGETESTGDVMGEKRSSVKKAEDDAFEILKGQVKGHYKTVGGKRVWVKPHMDKRTKKTEGIDHKATHEKYKKNEEINHHTENVKMLVDKYGSADDKKKFDKISSGIGNQGMTSEQSNAMYKLQQPLYKKMMDGVKGSESDSGSSKESIDYLEQYDKQPKEVQALIAKYTEEDGGTEYSELKKLASELDKIGWDMDYDMDGSITELKPKKEGESNKPSKYAEILKNTQESIKEYERSLKEDDISDSDREMGEHDLKKLKREEKMQQKLVDDESKGDVKKAVDTAFDILKGQVKGHYREINGKRVFVKPHSDKRTKKQESKSSDIKSGDMVKVKEHGWVMKVSSTKKMDDGSTMYNLENDKGSTGNVGRYHRDDIEPMKQGDSKPKKHETSNYHNTRSEALQDAVKMAESRGFEVDSQDLSFRLGEGNLKYEETKSASIGLTKDGKEAKKNLQISLYRMPSGKYELTSYIN